MVSGGGVFYLGLGVTLAATGQLLLKQGVSNLAPFSNRAISQFFASVAGSPWVWAGVIAYGLSSVVWLVVIPRMPLSVAYPALSAGYAAVIILSAVFFGEPLTGWKVFSGALNHIRRPAPRVSRMTPVLAELNFKASRPRRAGGVSECDLMCV